MAGKPRLGCNPDVFSYQFSGPDQFGLYSVHLLFYGGHDVFVAMIPDDSNMPYNLGMDLLNRGICTTITLGDAEYHFNVEDSETEGAG